MSELAREKVWRDPIVTELLPAPRFWPAEDYHQEYLASNPMQPYCRFVVAPKAAWLRQKFRDRLKKAANAH